MKPQLLFVTQNAHKMQEIAAKLGSTIQLLSLNEVGGLEEIPETGTTFQENASIKSHYAASRYTYACFADDSGLEVEALNAAPGVYSARYAGEGAGSEANMDKLLLAMQGQSNRKARFRTVISLLWNGGEHFFEGTIEGTIRTERSGAKGFGYDPVFEPEGYDITFAEMSLEEKNAISHRAKALEQLTAFLSTANPEK